MHSIHTPTLSKRQKPSNKKAFALVLSLALMGFMVLLIVTLATMVQMQMRLSRQAMIDFKAKQAAKFAAYQAMSRIQSALGPDQRISANAMMFDPAVYSGIKSLESDNRYDWWTSPMSIERDEVEKIDDVAVSQNRYWLGVWDSRRGYHPELQKREQARSEYVSNTVEKALTWLVSGNIVRSPKNTASIPHYLPTKTLDDGKYARLVAGGSSSDSYGARRPEHDVLAPLVKLDVDPNAVTGETITDGKETRIAWWVSDENQKASLNAVAQQNILEHASRIDYRVQSMPFYSGIHGLTLPGSGNRAGAKAFDFDFSSGGDDSSISRIRNLDDIAQLDIFRSGAIPENMQLSKIFFHSASFNTKGLLVNVRDGGLKKDLSLGLTRKDFGNETEELGNKDNNKPTEYFERPYGVSGYDFKTTAFPLQNDKIHNYHLDPNKTSEPDRKLKGKGHIFGPQMYGHEYIADAEQMSAITMVSHMFDDKYIWKDPGGPLWDQLRSYYNLRAEDLADRATLNERVQTDDRFGLKPVVKRFQVFYVPTFVNYGGSKYGLRLHIIPMLVLYNPFDTKIKGDTYYAIRVYAHFRHCVGAFRFAIGYNVGNYFQCLRDLRTEMMPSLATEVTRPTPDIIRQQQFLVPFRLGANWYSSKYFQSSEKCFDNDEEYPSRWWMSRYTRFYRGYGKPGQNANTISAYPLGYGMKINPSTTDIKNAIAPSNIARPSTNQWLHWKGIVAEGNIVPTETVAATQAGTEKYAARVARIPLYLNNIVYAVTHGKYTNSINRSSGNDNYLLFLSQRSIDARNPDKAPQTNGCDDANLVFLAYDAKGIEPGKAKIFSMRRIVSYVGDPLNASTKNDDGPNGVVEKTDTTSLYETKNAMLHGLDDGGVLGGCFYVDIPHPESEHAAKYANDNDWRYGSDYGKYIMFDLSEIARFQCFAFNGSRMNPSINDLYIDMSDVQGMYPRIEMTSNGENKRAIGGQFNMTPLGYGISTYNVDYSRHNQCDGSLKTDARHWSANHMHNIEYIRLNLDVWIWKREGFKFARYSNNNVNGADYNYSTPIMGPTIAHMVGSRFFLFQEPSFPDPYSAPAFNAKTSNVTFVKDYTCVYVNYHCPGMAYSTNGLVSLAAMRNTRYSEKAYTSVGMGSTSTVDGYLNQVAKFTTPINSAGSKNEKQFIDGTREHADLDPTGRARFYLNWLAVNPRRHSANYWERYDDTQLTNPNSGFKDSFRPTKSTVPNTTSKEAVMAEYSTTNYQGLADILPQAVRPPTSLTIMNGNYGYTSALHSAINNTNGTVPYGIVFALPYSSENEPGHEPFFNVRAFVNTNIQATGYYPDGSGLDVSMGQKYNTMSRLPKHMQAINQAYGTKDGMTSVGYTINTDGEGVRTGLKETTGTFRSPIFHILRKTEVVNNPANLASANLTFGVGRYKRLQWQAKNDDTMSSTIYQRSYSIEAYEAQHPSIAIGNSLCPSRISPERPYHVTWIDGAGVSWEYNNNSNNQVNTGKFDGKRESNYYEDRNALYDMSWLLNDALWDEYYFSTLPYRKDESRDTADSEIAYPQNPRLQYCVDRDDMVRLSELNSSTTEDQFDQNSSKMWVNGAFNVNSTSIDAWKAVLSTYYGIEYKDYQGRSKTLPDAAPFMRWAAPYSGDEFNENSSSDMEDNAFQAFRALSEDEIEQLAAAIVEHVKDRGPFYSMSHFVNRVSAVMSAEQRYTENYLGEDLVPLPQKEDDRKNLSKEYADKITHRIDHAQKGVLQAAIDSTSINRAFHRDDDTIISVDNGRNMSEMLKNDADLGIFKDPRKLWENWRGAIGPQATGIPGYLMQVDLLSKLGSFLTVRSDTFKIRAYGEVRNPVSGAIEGKAWCEMIVQRTPEYIDSESANQEPWRVSGREIEIGYQNNVTSSKNYNQHIDELNDLNKELGRRFKIVSFRWLNEKEI